MDLTLIVLCAEQVQFCNFNMLRRKIIICWEKSSLKHHHIITPLPFLALTMHLIINNIVICMMPVTF